MILLTVASASAQLSVGPFLEALSNRDVSAASQAVERLPSPLGEEARSQVREAIEHIQPGGEWLPVLKTLVEQNPSDAELTYELARANWRAGDEDAAVRLASEAVSKDPDNEYLLYRVAAIAYAVHRYDEAKQWLNNLLDKNPDYLDGLFLLGCIEARQGEDDKARKTLRRVLEIDPKHFMAHCEMGKLENRAGNSKAAERHLRVTINGYPFFREAYNALIVALSRQNKTEEVGEMREILKTLNSWTSQKLNRLWYAFRNPTSVPPMEAYELAAELCRVKREDLAERYLERLIEEGQTNDLQRFLLAQIRFNAGNHQGCLDLLKNIEMPRITEREMFATLKGWSLLRTGKIEEARTFYEDVANQYEDSRPLEALGKALGELKGSTDIPQAAAKENPFRFVDVTDKAGLGSFQHVLGHPDKRWITDAMGSGVAVADYDNDGDDDIYFACGRPELYSASPEYKNALFRNDDGVFTDVTEEAGVGDTGFGMSVIFGDVNNDGWLDLFVGNHGPNVLYRNNGDGTFTDITEEAGVGDKGYVASTAFADIDQDGDLDLFVGNYVAFNPEEHGEMRSPYHGIDVFMGPLAFTNQKDLLYINNGSGDFTDKAEEAGINVSPGRAMGAVFFDIENDGDLDLYVTNDSTYNHVLRNRGDGTFEDISFESGGAFTESGIEGASMGVVTGDYNNDGLLDLFITSYEQQTDILFRNEGDSILSDVTAPSKLARSSRMLITWGSGFCDFDADGFLDIFTSNGHLYPQVDSLELGRSYDQGASFYRNKGEEEFEDVTETVFSEDFKPRSGRGAALIDHDGDGDMDIVFNCIDSSPMLLENRSPRGSWLQVKLDALSALSFGTRIVARKGEQRWTRIVDGGSGYLSQSTQTIHFGFGSLREIDDLTIYWPGREPQAIESPPLNARIRVKFPYAVQ